MAAISRLFEQTMLLLGQAFHSVNYYRRQNILTALIVYLRKVKKIVKNPDMALDNVSHTCLFGDKFEKQLLKDTNAKQKSKLIFSGLQPTLVKHRIIASPFVELSTPSSRREQSSVLLVAGRLNHFQENWKKLTSDPQTLELVEGYQILFSSQPKQTKSSNPVHLTKKEESQVELEIQAMLRKGAFRMVGKSQNQFLGPIFLVEKKDSGYRPVINLKKLNQNIRYIHFKMEGLLLLKELLQKGDFSCTLDL